MTALHESLARLFAELVDGPPPDAAYMLNSGDAGLLRSLDTLSAAAASRTPASGAASIAAHVDHLCFGLDLMNRWSAGNPDPWSGADWTASWKRTVVTEDEWRTLRARLREVTDRWHAALKTPRDLSPIDLNVVIGSIAHLAYHVGAIRQIDYFHGPRA